MSKSQSSLRVYTRHDNILVFEARDTSVDTVRDWEAQANKYLDDLSSPKKRLYDLRRLNGLSIFAMRTAVRLRGHPRSHTIFVAILTRHSIIANMVQTALSIQPGGQYRVFFDESDAIAWLYEQDPEPKTDAG